MNQRDMEAFEMKTMMKMQMSLMSDCFEDCVQNFRDGAMTSGEKTCIQNCAKRTGATMQLMQSAQQSLAARAGGMNQF